MTNKNLGILIAVVLIAALVGFFAFNNSKNKPVSDVSANAPPVTETASASDMGTASAETAGKAPSESDPVVAKVDGENILRSEVVEFMKNFPPQMQQMPVEALFPMALEQVVTAKIVDEKAAKESDLANNAEVTKRLADARTQIIRTVFLEQEIEKQVTDDRLRKSYDEFRKTQESTPEVRARHILVETEDQAKDIITKLSEGAKFEDLAKQQSKDPSNKDQGGDLGYFGKAMMVKEFADAAFAMDKGEISKTPVKTQFGYHVIEVLDKRNKPVPSFEEVKLALAAEERRKILNEIVEDWRKSASVESFDINGKPIQKQVEVKPAAPAPTETPAPAAE